MSSFRETLYADLQREYDLTLDRRKTLTGQASTLMAFAAVIESILGSLIASLATSTSARQGFDSIPYHNWVLAGFVVAFLGFMASAAAALLAFREERWFRTPAVPGPDVNGNIEILFDHGGDTQWKLFAYQLNDATVKHQAVNDSKFLLLKIAQWALFVGVLAVGSSGIVVLLGL